MVRDHHRRSGVRLGEPRFQPGGMPLEQRRRRLRRERRLAELHHAEVAHEALRLAHCRVARRAVAGDAEVAPQRGLTKPQAAEASVCIAAWPTPDKSRQDATIEAQFADFQAVLGAVREIRQRQNIPFSETLEFTVRSDAATAKRLEPMQPYLMQMAKATGTAWGPNATAPDVAASITLSGQSGPLEVHVDVSRFIDVEAEKKRLQKLLEDNTKFIKSIDAKLSNAAFVDKAPAEVVQQQRDKRAELAAQLETVEAALKKLK